MIMDMKIEIRPDGNQADQFDTGSMLREWRVVNGLTQQQVAEKAGITQQQYQRFESGTRDLRRCSFEVACKVLEALQMDIVKFYHGEYTFGEEIYADQYGKLRYKRTGKLLTDDPDDTLTQNVKNEK